jgi:hypothetical protein
MAIAESMTYARERIQIANPGILLRSLASSVKSTFESIERVFTVATQEASYCTYNPAECRGIA